MEQKSLGKIKSKHVEFYTDYKSFGFGVEIDYEDIYKYPLQIVLQAFFWTLTINL